MLTQINRYLVAARQAGKSPATVRQYGWHLGKMAAWLSEQGCKDLGGVSRDALRQWGAELQNVWAPATVKQAVNAARAFLHWCAEEKLLGEDLGQALKVPPVPQRAQRTITAEEVQKLLEGCDRSAKGVRDKALINLLVDTGLRAREVCRLKVGDLDLKGRMLTVTVKGGQREFVFFGQTTAQRLKSWLVVRPSANGTATVFVSLGGNTPGRPLTTRGLRSNLKRLGERAGLRGVTTHAFRRGFACIATQAGAPTRVVQLAGRWSDIRMVERYTQDLERQALYEGGWSPADYLQSA